MRKNKNYLLLLVLTAFAACNNKESREDAVNKVNKNGSIETELSVEHINSGDVLVTKHKIWKDNRLFKEIVKRDTIPSLKDTVQEVEDVNGNSHIENIKKDYEFFITVQ